jgi:hypothetical protein
VGSTPTANKTEFPYDSLDGEKTDLPLFHITVRIPTHTHPIPIL